MSIKTHWRILKSVIESDIQYFQIMLIPSSATIWLSLVAMIWLQSINGTNFDFAAYSSQFKHLLSLSQFQLNNLAFASDAGKFLGWFAGIAALYLPLRLVLLIGATLGLVGYGVQFLVLADKITSLPYWVVFVHSALAGNSICWINTVCYVMTARNFPSHRQIAGGLSTSYIGLSGKIYILTVAGFFNGSPIKKAETYLLLNSLVPVIVSLLSAPLLREVKVEGPAKLEGGFLVLFILTVITGVYAVSGSIIRSMASWYRPELHETGLVVLLATPLVVPLTIIFKKNLGGKICSKLGENKVHDSAMNDASVQVEKGIYDDVKEEVEAKQENGTSGREVETKEMVKRLEFWLYYFMYMFGPAIGLVFLHNLGQITESRGSLKTVSLVSVSSSFGFFGRLMPPLLDYFLARYKLKITRPAYVATFMPLLAAAFFLLLHSSVICLYISTAVIGACTGAIMTIAVPMTTELFGVKYVSVNHNILLTNIPIGSFLYGNFAAFMYQQATTSHGDGRRCTGFDCYRLTFLVWGMICATGSLLSVLLYVRYCRAMLMSKESLDDSPKD